MKERLGMKLTFLHNSWCSGASRFLVTYFTYYTKFFATASKKLCITCHLKNKIASKISMYWINGFWASIFLRYRLYRFTFNLRLQISNNLETITKWVVKAFEVIIRCSNLKNCSSCAQKLWSWTKYFFWNLIGIWIVQTKVPSEVIFVVKSP